jgi:Methyltransferase domain
MRRLVPPALLEKQTTYKQFCLYEIESILRRGRNGEETTISISGDWAACPEATVLFQSLFKAVRAESKLSAEILDIDGMSGRKYRFFINDVIATLPNARYLEIGSWAGSTACSAMYGNNVEVTCIDDWSEFGGPKQKFLENVKLARSVSTDFRLIEADFRQVDYSTIGRFNTFLFDGPHNEHAHYDGIRLVQPALEDTFILVVDDWNWPEVRTGTLRAIADEKLERLFSIEIRSTQDNTHPKGAVGKRSDWHNGYILCVCRKAA